MSAKRDISSGQLARVAALVAEASRNDAIPDAFRVLVEGIVDLAGADRALVLLVQDHRLVTCYTDRGSEQCLGREAAVQGSLEGICFHRGGPVISDDVTRDRRFEGVDHEGDEISLMTLPLHLEGPPVGMVRLSSATPGLFGGHELTLARLVVAAMRKILLGAIRAEREALGIQDKDFAIAGVWALRDRRKSQLHRSSIDGGLVSLVKYEIRGYLTADIVHHISAVVRSSDHVFQDDAGTFTLILPGTGADDAELAARRVKGEIERLAEMDGDPIDVRWSVTELERDDGERRIA